MRESRSAHARGYLCRAARCRRGAPPANSSCRSSSLPRARVAANGRSYSPSGAPRELAPVSVGERCFARGRLAPAGHPTSFDVQTPSLKWASVLSPEKPIGDKDRLSSGSKHPEPLADRVMTRSGHCRAPGSGLSLSSEVTTVAAPRNVSHKSGRAERTSVPWPRRDVSRQRQPLALSSCTEPSPAVPNVFGRVRRRLTGTIEKWESDSVMDGGTACSARGGAPTKRLAPGPCCVLPRQDSRRPLGATMPPVLGSVREDTQSQPAALASFTFCVAAPIAERKPFVSPLL